MEENSFTLGEKSYHKSNVVVNGKEQLRKMDAEPIFANC